MPALVGLGTVNVIYGAISAMGQSDLKYVIGYSSVSHMGYVVMGIATLHPLGLSGAVLQMFSPRHNDCALLLPSWAWCMTARTRAICWCWTVWQSAWA